jgi:truncated hemoglobin YjbI
MVHFDRWMEIFTETLDELYTGATADDEANALRIWLTCSTTRSTILEMPTKRRSFKFKIIPSCANYCF